RKVRSSSRFATTRSVPSGGSCFSTARSSSPRSPVKVAVPDGSRPGAFSGTADATGPCTARGGSGGTHPPCAMRASSPSAQWRASRRASVLMSQEANMWLIGPGQLHAQLTKRRGAHYPVESDDVRVCHGEALEMVEPRDMPEVGRAPAKLQL